MYQNINSTNISFEAFKSITDSNGQFATYTDIINKAREQLPINEEIFLAPFKSMETVTGDNIVLKNTTTKFVEYLRDDLSDNNKLELNKMTMFLYDDYMTSYDYDLIDQHSAVEWSDLIADMVDQMFVSKQDISNTLALDEIQKIALALGNFTIIPNADKLLVNNNGEVEYSRYKAIGAVQTRIKNSYRSKRTKFAKGINVNELKWVNSYDFSLNLLLSLTNGVPGSNEAYDDLKQRNVIRNFLGNLYTESMYLGTNVLMGEFKYQDTSGQVQTANAGSYTGNIIKPFIFEHLFSMSWLPRSLLYYGHRFETTDRPKVNSRTKAVISFMWRSQVAINPVFAGFNHIFITKLPSFPSYIKRDGSTVPARNLATYNDYVEFKKDIRKEQPMLYNTFIDENGIVSSNGINSESTWTTYQTNNTFNLTNGLTPVTITRENPTEKAKIREFFKK